MLKHRVAGWGIVDKLRKTVFENVPTGGMYMNVHHMYVCMYTCIHTYMYLHVNFVDGFKMF